MERLGIQRDLSVKSVLRFSFLSLVCTIMIGLGVVGLCHLFYSDDVTRILDKTTIPQHFLNIFSNNAWCFIVFTLPYVGFLNYCLAIFFVHVYVGTSVLAVGWGETLVKLWHYPLEMGTFGIALYLSYYLSRTRWKLVDWRRVVLSVAIGMILLLVASIVEIQMI